MACGGVMMNAEFSATSTVPGQTQKENEMHRARRQRKIRNTLHNNINSNNMNARHKRRPFAMPNLLLSAGLLLLLLLESSTAQSTATAATNDTETAASSTSVCDPTCDAGGVFIMSFVFLGTPEQASLSATQSGLFQEFMVSLTARFAPPLEFPLVETTCLFIFEDSNEFLPLVLPEVPASTTEPPLENRVNATEDTRVNNNSNNNSDNVPPPENRYRYLTQQQQPHHMNENNHNTRSLQEVASVTLSSGNDTVVLASVNETSSLLQYIFRMDYTSSEVDVATYPAQFVAYTLSELAAMSLELALLLEIEPTERVKIQDIRELAPLAETADATNVPTILAPTVSPVPTGAPSVSSAPTPVPSSLPTVFPTFVGGENMTVIQYFSLDFTLQAPARAGFMNLTEQDEYCNKLEAQTADIAPADTYTRVVTTCAFLDAISKVSASPILPAVPASSEAPVEEPNGTVVEDGISTSTNPDLNGRQRQLRQPKAGWNANNRGIDPWNFSSDTAQRGLQKATVTTIYTYFFSMMYTSISVNVSTFPQDFQVHLVENAGEFNAMLTDVLGLDADNNLTFTEIGTYEVNTEAPSLAPSEAPSYRPSESFSAFPTRLPTGPPNTEVPTAIPSEAPTVFIVEPSDSNDTVLIVVGVVAGLVCFALLVGLVLLYQKRQAKLESIRAEQRAASNTYQGGGSNGNGRTDSGHFKPQEGCTEFATFSQDEIHRGGYPNGQPHDTVATSPLSPDYHGNGQRYNGHFMMPRSTSESILSNPSLLSNGQDDDDDYDDDLNPHDDDLLQRSSKLSPLDDFDRFKDQNLENMRSSVEANVAGIDGMMSQALTMALMDGGNPSVGMLWDGATSGEEIEANALCEVTDWMKRHDFASFDEQQSFMQTILNKMVISVRQGFMNPDDASRTIHECASLLNLQLATHLPATCIILSGMRKTATANDVTRAFRRYGAIDDAAVASNERGFGLVRFRNPKAIDQVMIKFRTAEIVVQDVAVQVKVLGQDL